MRVLITDTFARNHKPASDRQDIFDTQVPGLRLRISKSGVRSWDFRYEAPATGKIVSMKIGSYPATTVGAARERALEALSHVEAKRDPRQVFAAQQAAGLTVAKLIETYLEERPLERKHGMTSVAKVKGIMDKHVVPVIGGVPVADLALHISEITKPALKRGHRSTANRVVATLKAMTRWAKRRKKIDHDPLAEVEQPAEESDPEKRTLGNDELALFRQRLETAIPDGPRQRVLHAKTVRRILMLILLTGARPSEICEMRKSEVEDETFSMTDPLRCKNRKPHKFHLCRMAREIVKEAIADAKGSKFVFPSTGKLPHVIIPNIDNVVARAVKPSKKHPRGRFGIAPFTPHDLRRSVLDGLERLGVPPHVVSALAAHESAFKTVTSKHYTSYRYDTERAAALDLWADHLASLGNVAALRRAA